MTSHPERIMSARLFLPTVANSVRSQPCRRLRLGHLIAFNQRQARHASCIIS